MNTETSAAQPLAAIIADDEPLARHQLRRQLELQNVKVLAEASNAGESLRLCIEHCPDVLFLDIQMPGVDGMAAASALRELSVPPLLVFVTGFSEYGAAAFERDAVDYLMKPVLAERLLATLARIDERRAQHRIAAAKLESPSAGPLPPADTLQDPLRRLPARGEYAVIMLFTEEIVYAQGRDKGVFLRTADGSEHRSFHTLTELDSLLPVERFCRIHDSYVVNLDHVRELNFLGNRTYSVSLKDGKTLPVGRTRYAELRRRLHLPA